MTFILNFHGIGQCTRAFETDEEPYWISEQQFADCLDLAEQSGGKVAYTFDDGNASDYQVALPTMIKRQLAAIFFVLAGKIGQPGYLSASQIEEIADTEKMQLGSHGMDHKPWPMQDDNDLDRELAESRRSLEEICRRPVTQAALPLGLYDGRVLRRLKSHGYTRIYSSDGGPKLFAASPVPRFSVRSDTDMTVLAKMMRGASTVQRAKTELRVLAKSLR